MTTPEGVVHKTLYDDTAAGIARSRVKEQQLQPVGGSFITQASYAYYPLGAAHEGRLQTLTNAENATTSYTYDAAGHVLTQTGTASYPLRYEYDTLDRLWKLHTYRAASPDLTQAGDVTTWVYDPASGKLTRKLDAANRGPSYTYTAGGLLHTRTWQRGVVTTYAYDGAGRLTGIAYDDTTPEVAHGYDRAGRRTSTTDAAGAHTLAYDGSQLDTWTVNGAGAPWSGLSVDYGITAGRRSGREASLGGITVPAVSYSYATTSGALESVSTAGAGSTTVTATYRRTAATGWNDGVTYSVGTSTKLSSTRTPDTRGRLEAVSWVNGANAVLSGHDYTLDEMNRRTAAQRQDGSKWNYGYNDRGEVTSAAKEDAAQIPEPGKQYGFAFDGLGNRTSSTVSSLNDDQTLRTTGYSANELNQYTQITHPQPGWLVLRGSAYTEATVTIDIEPPTLRAGPLWHYEKSVDNSSGATRRIAEITATRPDGGLNNGPISATRKGATFIPPPTELPTHDPDGNQTSDARWNYAWNGENRLILAEEKVIPVSVAAGVSMPTVTTRQKLEFSYDSQGRRLTKKVYEQRTENGAPATFVLKQSVVFLYDGWNMIAEIDTTTSARLLRSYEWGLDMSGTMDGAGGVGGLLVVREHPVSSNQSPASSHAPCYDGNGNVMELVNLTTGGVSARYEYGAFGETISVDGDAIADANPIRFSTKYLDGETGLLYYGYRFYSPELGRWLARDPIEERGGLNLYGMVANNAVAFFDRLGLEIDPLFYDFPPPGSPGPPGFPDPRKDWEASVAYFGNVADGLPRRMLHHWFYGDGRDYWLTENDFHLCVKSQHADLMRSDEFKSDLEKYMKSDGYFEGEYRSGTDSAVARTLGNFQLIMKVTVSCHPRGWHAVGTIEGDEGMRYDFNPGNRPDEFEVTMMRWLNHLTVGPKDYDVYVRPIKFEQTAGASWGSIDWKSRAVWK